MYSVASNITNIVMYIIWFYVPRKNTAST